MSSAESLATARAKTYANGIVLTGGSRTLVETWGLQIADGGEFSAFRYVDAEACRVSRDAKDLRGASVNAAKTGELQLWYAQAAPIAMPVGRVEVNGGARVVSPRVHAVDVFVEVDGESFSDGHVCYGADAKSSRDEAINAACRDTPMSKTWMRDFLKNGPSDGTKPWATLVKSRGWTNEESCVYLPLMARDVDNALMGDDTLTYGHSLMDKWSRLLAKVGPGERTFTLRVRPRGVVFMDVRGEPQYDFVGETSGDASVKRKIIASFVGEHLTAADEIGMSASCVVDDDARRFAMRRSSAGAHGARVYLGMVIERDQKVHPDRDETRQRGSVWRDGEKDGAELDVLPRHPLRRRTRLGRRHGYERRRRAYVRLFLRVGAV